MAEGFWFNPETEETSFLSSVPVNAVLRAEVRIVRNLYRNEDTGYSVYNVEDLENHWFKVKGYFPTALKLDSYYTVDGVVKDSKDGRALQITEYKSSLPRDQNSIITVLRTLPRLDTRAPVVYDALGDSALELILSNPEEVASRIKGISLNMVLSWQSVLRNLKEGDVILQALRDYKIPVSAAKQLLEKYPDIIERLRRSPYFLADEVRGLSFVKCDKIALDNNYPLNGQERLQQAMRYVLSQAGQVRGDCYLPATEFFEAVRRVIDVSVDFRTARSLLAKNGGQSIQCGSRTISVDKTALREAFTAWQKNNKQRPFSFTCERVSDEDLNMALDSLRSLSKIVTEDDRVYLGNLHDAEVSITNHLKAMVASEYGAFPNASSVLEKVCREDGIVLEAKQKEAVLRICSSRGGVFVLNGRAGCGKTFTLNIIVKVLKELYLQQDLFFSVEVMAPTGKAAQVARKATGLQARTVHKALHLVADKGAEPSATIAGECIVIDEFSMMGLTLTSYLLRAISSGVKVIIMGDFEQLQSIDPGNVLSDIIASGIVPVITLDVVKRQAEGSGVLYNANEILEGNMIRSKIIDKSRLKDNAYIFRSDSPQVCCESIVQMVVNLRRKGIALDDIQVLCPQKKTEVGIDAINYFVQSAVNPSVGGKEVLSKFIEVKDAFGVAQTEKLFFREGDKVIHTANSYEMRFYKFQKGEGFVDDLSRIGIVNGETGRIAKILEVKNGQKTHQRIYVQYGPNQFAMYEDNWDDLSMAYAMTIHRAQGSQWPIVIAPIMFCNKRMLSRNLFYTLYTRAQSATMIYGSPDAIEFAIKNNTSTKRYTWLKQRLAAA